MKHWSKAAIERWHNETFPECEVGCQRIKLAEEAEEFYYAKGKAARLEELADVYIVCVSLWFRYHDYAGRFILDRIEKSGVFDELQDVIDAKMDTNVMRKWYKISGTYRHKNEW